MGGNVEKIKERLDIAEVLSGYLKLEKAGASFKARCPFHNEKTPSFFVSPTRQSYYCFGCGAKGDIFTFIEEMEGLDFRETLKVLAERAGVELKFESREPRGEKDKLFEVINLALEFFEKSRDENSAVRKYLHSRGVSEDSIKRWRIGYAKDEWRALSSHLRSLGIDSGLAIKAGLIKNHVASTSKDPQKEPYDVFRNRIVFPLFDTSGRVIAFSGRAMPASQRDIQETEPKYLNSPDTVLFTKSEVLYGLNLAKEEIRKKNYAVLVEGQIDLVLSHQAGVVNTVASSGTAFSTQHLSRLKRFSPRIILAFDGDSAGEKAAMRSTELGFSLGMEVKIAILSDGSDPASIISEDPESWRNILRQSLPAPEFFLTKILEREKDGRRVGGLIVKNILPIVALVPSSIERSHFVSIIAKRSGIKESAIWDDLGKIKISRANPSPSLESSEESDEEKDQPIIKKSYREVANERLAEIRAWNMELTEGSTERSHLVREESELIDNLEHEDLRLRLSQLISEVAQAEGQGDSEAVWHLSKETQNLLSKIRALEENRKKI